MIKVISRQNGGWVSVGRGAPASIPAESWVDLVNPGPEEIKLVGSLLSIEIPTRQEMEEIEISSRLYQEDGAYFLTAMVLSVPDAENLQASSITFILAERHLVTVRYLEPKPFDMIAARLQRPGNNCGTNLDVLIALLEAIIDRMADILEYHSAEVEKTSRLIFSREKKASEKLDLQETIKDIGAEGNHISTMRESLASVSRMAIYLNQVVAAKPNSAGVRTRLKVIGQDLGSLADYAAFMANKVNFLLDATLGMISIQQNQIIKIVSVAAVVFLPPTLIASVYGMNFHFIPELKWSLGYPLAILLMIGSAILPYRYFKRKGWL
jgi:magnesium transporter